MIPRAAGFFSIGGRYPPVSVRFDLWGLNLKGTTAGAHRQTWQAQSPTDLDTGWRRVIIKTIQRTGLAR
jgi:hypothetical protein